MRATIDYQDVTYTVDRYLNVTGEGKHAELLEDLIRVLPVSPSMGDRMTAVAYLLRQYGINATADPVSDVPDEIGTSAAPVNPKGFYKSQQPTDRDQDGRIFDGTDRERAAPHQSKPTPARRKPGKDGASEGPATPAMGEFKSPREWVNYLHSIGQRPPRMPMTGKGRQDGIKHIQWEPVPPDSKNSDHVSMPGDEDVPRLLRDGKWQHSFRNREVPDGTMVGLRIDVPAYNDHGVYVVSIHGREGASNTQTGKILGYDRMARIKNATFWSNEGVAMLIQEGAAKSTIAAVRGGIVQDRTIPEDINDWTPVGYNPKKAVFYYDKKTGMEVTSAEEAISIGNTVFAKNPVYGERNAATDYAQLTPEWKSWYDSKKDKTLAFEDYFRKADLEDYLAYKGLTSIGIWRKAGGKLIPKPIDGDGDGFIHDGTQREQRASKPKEDKPKRTRKQLYASILDRAQAELTMATNALDKAEKELSTAKDKRDATRVAYEAARKLAIEEMEQIRQEGETNQQVLDRLGREEMQRIRDEISSKHNLTEIEKEKARLDSEVNDLIKEHRNRKSNWNKVFRRHRYAQSINQPGFAEWFGDSKAVDEGGLPLVIYHGTKSGGFTKFKESSNFNQGVFGSTNIDIARSYAGGYENDITPTFKSWDELVSEEGLIDILYGHEDHDWASTEEEAKRFREESGEDYEIKLLYRLINSNGEVYSESENKEDILDDYNSNPEEFATAAAGVYALFYAIGDVYEYDAEGRNWDDVTGEGDRTVELARDAYYAGVDGVIFRNVMDYGSYTGDWAPGDVYVSFKANNIKSVYNTGSFDPKDADIRKAIQLAWKKRPPRDRDGDGLIYDGTDRERAAPRRGKPQAKPTKPSRPKPKPRPRPKPPEPSERQGKPVRLRGREDKFREHMGDMAGNLRTVGGFTYNPKYARSPKSGFSIAKNPQYEIKIPLRQATPKRVAQYMIEHLEVLESDSTLMVGGWYNKKTAGNPKGDNLVYLDIPTVVQDRDEAIRLAIENCQLAIFDLKRKVEIHTMTKEERKECEKRKRAEKRGKKNDKTKSFAGAVRQDPGGNSGGSRGDVRGHDGATGYPGRNPRTGRVYLGSKSQTGVTRKEAQGQAQEAQEVAAGAGEDTSDDEDLNRPTPLSSAKVRELFRNEIESMRQDPGIEFIEADLADFILARDASIAPSVFGPMDADDLGLDSKAYLSESGLSGYVLTPGGDLRGMFGGEPGGGLAAALHAIETGAAGVDAYEPVLTRYYHQLGFVAHEAWAFDPSLAIDWDLDGDGMPDYVYMHWPSDRPRDRESVLKGIGTYGAYQNPADRNGYEVDTRE